MWKTERLLPQISWHDVHLGGASGVCVRRDLFIWVTDSFICVTWLMILCHTWRVFRCVCATWLVYMSYVTRLYLWHDSQGYVQLSGPSVVFVRIDLLIWGAWLVCMCDMTHNTMFTLAVLQVCVCNMTRSHLWRDPFISVPWLIRMCDFTHSYVWRDSFISGPWLIHICAMTHP